MNEKLKKEFVAQYSESPATRKLAQSTLRLLAPFEREWGMDYTLQSLPELESAVNQIIGVRRQSAKVAMTILQKYAQWRKDNGHPTGDAIFSVELDTINQMRQHMVSSPTHLKMILDAAFDPPTMETADCVYRALLWMGFAGLTATESVQVRAEDVRMKDMTILYEGIEHPIYREAISDFENARSLDSFVDIKLRDGNAIYRRIKRAEGTEILRGKSNTRTKPPEQMIRSTFRPMLARKLAEAEKRNDNLDQPANLSFDISYDRVYMSGIFYRAYEKERFGISADFVEQAKRELERRKKRMQPKSITPRYEQKTLQTVIHDYKQDYEAWKKAFEV